MELPKNIVQIGNPDKHYKIFVEDYVISYIKQINRKLNGGQAGIALYGKKYVEDELRYYFLYGATEIAGLENRGQYLSDMEKEQIESKKREFFEEQEFLAWCTLNGEMPDGFYLLDQGKGVLIDGYATFFEKNENMLNFMIIVGNRENNRAGEGNESGAQRRREEEYEWGRLAQGGNIDHRLLERNRKLSDMRKTRGERYRNTVVPGHSADKYEKNGSWKTLLTGVAVMLCVIGIATLSDEEKMKDLQVAAGQILENLNEQKLPDAEEQILDNVELCSEIQSETQTETIPWQQPESQPESQIESQTEPQSQTQPESEVQSEPDETQTAEVSAPQEETEVSSTTVTYVVEKGDMLLTICRERYGSVEMLRKICELNGIDDPDDIKVGQIILLPE